MSARHEGLPEPVLKDRGDFMARFRGVKAYIVANALNSITHGINWTGCSKGLMANRWAWARSNDNRQRAGYDALSRASLDDIEAAVQRELHPSVPRG